MSQLLNRKIRKVIIGTVLLSIFGIGILLTTARNTVNPVLQAQTPVSAESAQPAR